MIYEREYVAYLLRIVRFSSGEKVVWRISLESPQTRMRVVLTSLDELCSYLEREIGQQSIKKTPTGRLLTASWESGCGDATDVPGKQNAQARAKVAGRKDIEE